MSTDGKQIDILVMGTVTNTIEEGIHTPKLDQSLL
jgi:hypothetical protein